MASAQDGADGQTGFSKASKFKPQFTKSFREPFRIPGKYLQGLREGADLGSLDSQVAPKTPIIVFVNAKSGGRAGEQLAQLFESVLGEGQVFLLGTHDPKKILKKLYENLGAYPPPPGNTASRPQSAGSRGHQQAGNRQNPPAEMTEEPGQHEDEDDIGEDANIDVAAMLAHSRAICQDAAPKISHPEAHIPHPELAHQVPHVGPHAFQLDQQMQQRSGTGQFGNHPLAMRPNGPYWSVPQSPDNGGGEYSWRPQQQQQQQQLDQNGWSQGNSHLTAFQQPQEQQQGLGSSQQSRNGWDENGAAAYQQPTHDGSFGIRSPLGGPYDNGLGQWPPNHRQDGYINHPSQNSHPQEPWTGPFGHPSQQNAYTDELLRGPQGQAVVHDPSMHYRLQDPPSQQQQATLARLPVRSESSRSLHASYEDFKLLRRSPQVSRKSLLDPHDDQALSGSRTPPRELEFEDPDEALYLRHMLRRSRELSYEETDIPFPEGETYQDRKDTLRLRGGYPSPHSSMPHSPAASAAGVGYQQQGQSGDGSRAASGTHSSAQQGGNQGNGHSERSGEQGRGQQSGSRMRIEESTGPKDQKKVVDALRALENSEPASGQQGGRAWGPGDKDPVAEQILSTLRIMACGGDGSVTWVLQSISDLDLKPRPPVGVIPLGTGNGMSCNLGWGKTMRAEWIVSRASMFQELKAVANAAVRKLDSWDITISTPEQGMHRIDELPAATHPEVDGKKDKKAATDVRGRFYYYFSVGLDAETAYRFHTFREKNPKWTNRRHLNHFWYAWMAGRTGWIRPGVKSLHQALPSFKWRRSDGQWQETVIQKDIRALVILNFQSYSGGKDIWGLHDYRIQEESDKGFGKPIFDDGHIEVIGLKGLFHTFAVLSGANRHWHGKRLAQASELVFDFKAAGDLPITHFRLDGEPWVQPLAPSATGPVRVSIKKADPARILLNTSELPHTTNRALKLAQRELELSSPEELDSSSSSSGGDAKNRVWLRLQGAFHKNRSGHQPGARSFNERLPGR
ncbi:hypothetical protein WJX84_009673 [Apatococcus fuscideae]|uniref:Diacylglycerol kinase n=1 Tax=Apatococcus fuscideae TaxID=2026836 RepID=A0AAW1SPY6_9CHLO